MKLSQNTDVSTISRLGPYDFFFRKLDYCLEKGKGVSLFATSDREIEQFVEQCKQSGFSHLLIRFSSLGQTAPDFSKFHGFIVIIQDLSFAEFLERSAFIADKIIFPLWFRRVPVCFFSFLERSVYDDLILSGNELHKNYAMILNSLLCEQINTLLERVNYQFSTPDFLSFNEQNGIFTPIEEKFTQALVSNHLAFQTQVRIGRYIVDFVVSHENKRLIVECDGKAYHDPDKDRERDKVLSAEGYPICHFSGADILVDTEKCIEIIKNRLDTYELSSYLIDEDLDPSQMAAVRSVAGPIRVLAPAGSGKTKTLINRILNLLNQGVLPEKILALAFNKKARDEMQERLERKGIHGIEVRTFHSLGYEIVRESLGWTFSGSWTRKIARNLMRAAVQEHTDLPLLRNKDPLDSFLDGLRKAKMDLPDLSTLTVEFGDRIYPFEPIFYSYLKKQLDRNYLDFDDMIYLALRVLLENRSLRKAYQSHFEFILVDEFQDLNQAQLFFLQILSLPENNVFAVGDDDQMIYGFRGAEVKHIIEFDKRFPVSTSHVLNTNYRSSRMIVRHTGWLIEHNTDRVKKNIQPRQGAQQGSFEISGHVSVFEQAEFMGNWLVEHKAKHNLQWNDYAVLYRYNAYQFPVALVLDKLNAPHTPLMGQRLFQTHVGRDVYAYFQVILSPNEATPSDFECILKRPNKYFSNQLIARARNWSSFLRLPKTPGLRNWEVEKLDDFICRLHLCANQARTTGASPADLMHTIKIKLGLLDFYRDQARLSDDLDQASDEDILDVIIALSENFNTVSDFYYFLCKSIDDSEPDQHGMVTTVDDNQRDEIYLGTIHRAKGKEFQNVVYFNLCKSSTKSGKVGEEEERRVAYVGATRPKDCLLITFPNAKPSVFLKEISLNPKFNGIQDEDIARSFTSTSLRYKTEKRRVEQLGLNRDKLLSQFEQLVESPAVPAFSIRERIARLFTDWRIRDIGKKIESIEQNIKKRREMIIDPLLIELNDLEEESRIRKELIRPQPPETA